MREFYVEVSRVKWEDVGGLYNAKRTLHDNLIVSIKEPEKLFSNGSENTKRCLTIWSRLWKTLIAKSLATIVSQIL